MSYYKKLKNYFCRNVTLPVHLSRRYGGGKWLPINGHQGLFSISRVDPLLCGSGAQGSEGTGWGLEKGALRSEFGGWSGEGNKDNCEPRGPIGPLGPPHTHTDPTRWNVILLRLASLSHDGMSAHPKQDVTPHSGLHLQLPDCTCLLLLPAHKQP